MKDHMCTILGAGAIGSSWAIVFARKGYPVLLYDSDPRAYEPAASYIETSLKGLKEEGLIPDEQDVRSRITTIKSLSDAIPEADFIIESIAEDTEAKFKLMCDLEDFIPPDALVMSSTSAIPGSEFMGQVTFRDRCLVAHPVNPPHLIPLVECCATPWTSPSAFDACLSLMKELGQHPIRINKEIHAFVLNRLQAALIGEAMYLVDEGVVSVEDLDCALKYGFGRRLAFTGPFESMHLNAALSFDTYLEKYSAGLRDILDRLQVNHSWSQDLLNRIASERNRLLPADKISDRKAWRDRQLMKLAKI